MLSLPYNLNQCTDQNSDSDSVDLKVNIFVELQHFC